MALSSIKWKVQWHCMNSKQSPTVGTIVAATIIQPVETVLAVNILHD